MICFIPALWGLWTMDNIPTAKMMLSLEISSSTLESPTKHSFPFDNRDFFPSLYSRQHHENSWSPLIQKWPITLTCLQRDWLCMSIKLSVSSLWSLFFFRQKVLSSTSSGSSWKEEKRVSKEAKSVVAGVDFPLFSMGITHRNIWTIFNKYSLKRMVIYTFMRLLQLSCQLDTFYDIVIVDLWINDNREN